MTRLTKLRPVNAICTLVALVLGLLVSACTNERLQNDAVYKETFSSILISQDGQKLVVLGRRYHYIFDVPEQLRILFASPLHRKTYADFGNFKVSPDGRIDGDLHLYLPENHNRYSEEEKKSATDLGMKVFSDWRYMMKVPMAGERYESTDIGKSAASLTLNRTYDAYIREIASSDELRRRERLSPIAKNIDGVLSIAAIPLFPVFLIMAIGGCNACR